LISRAVINLVVDEEGGHVIQQLLEAAQLVTLQYGVMFLQQSCQQYCELILPLLNCCLAHCKRILHVPYGSQVRMNGGTNIAAAVAKAGSLLKADADAGPQTRRVLVLLTDGR